MFHTDKKETRQIVSEQFHNGTSAHERPFYAINVLYSNRYI